MPKKRRFINKNHEEKAHPDSPDGLLVAASKNKRFAHRFVSEFRKLQGHEFRNLQKRSINLKTKKLGCSYFVRLSMH